MLCATDRIAYPGSTDDCLEQPHGVGHAEPDAYIHVAMER